MEMRANLAAGHVFLGPPAQFPAFNLFKFQMARKLIHYGAIGRAAQ